MRQLYLVGFYAVILLVINDEAAWSQTDQNTIIGYRAGAVLTGTANTFIGYQAGLNAQSGGSNVFIGQNTGYSNTSGYANLFLGQQAGWTNSTGAYNTFIGSSSGMANTVGTNNNFIGNGAGLANTEGNFNVFIGSEAGAKNMRGGSNVQIGAYAGKECLDCGGNTFIGHNANVPQGATLNNVTVLGYNAVATASNSVILGNGANVGIGTSAPQNRLEITHGTAGLSGLRFTNLTSSSPLYGNGTNQFLTVNANGDVVLAAIGGSKGFRAAATPDSLATWANEGNNLRNANEGGVVIGHGVSKLPGGYKLFVEQGILTERVKVAVKSSSEWSDYVFAPGYRLAPLSDVEKQIQQTGHLPGVPSASEMVDKGMDVAKMDAKLLEKIEELTLYGIQQQKRLELLEQYYRQLKDELTTLKKP